MEVYKKAADEFTDNISKVLHKVSLEDYKHVTEIRLRKNCPISLTISGKTLYVNADGELLKSPDNCFKITEADITNSIYKMCDNSLYAYSKEIANGFVTTKNGNRVGISGTAVYNGNILTTLNKFSSINLRISREYINCSKTIYDYIKSENNGYNLLVLSAPGGGKTTFLRDIARQFSKDNKNVCICDERSEIAAQKNDLGYCVDILDRYEKQKAISIATRCFSPEIIVCDEVGTVNEVSEIISAIHCGVSFICSAHIGKIEDVFLRPQLIELFNNKIFDYIVFLDSHASPGRIIDFFKVDYNDKGDRTFDNIFSLHSIIL